MTVQTQTQDVFNLAWKYIDTLRKELTSRLEELLRKHGVKLHDLFVTYKTENDIVKFKVEVEVDQSSIGYLREVVGDAEALQRVIDRDTQYVVGELDSILKALEILA